MFAPQSGIGPRRAHEIAGRATVLDGHRARGVVRRPELLDLAPRDGRVLEALGQPRLHRSLPPMPFGQQRAGTFEVLVGEREDLGERHPGADDSVGAMSPKTVTGVELELDDGPVRDAELFLVDGNNLAYRAFFALPEELQQYVLGTSR